MRVHGLRMRIGGRLQAVLLLSTVAGCSATASEEALNVLGSVGGQIIGQQIGGVGGHLVAKLGSNAGTIASALDNSEEGEKLRAVRLASEVEAKVGASRDQKMERYLQHMVGRLGQAAQKVVPTDRSYNYEIILLADQSFNAATPGGGKILVNEGLLAVCENEAQTAAVLAHEMAHILKRHPKHGSQVGAAAAVGATVLEALAPQVTSGATGAAVALGASAALNRFSREQEAEADAIGMRILAEAGYDPYEMVMVQRIMSQIGPQQGDLENFFFGNHPTGSARVAAAEREYAKLKSEGRVRDVIKDSATYRSLAARYKEV